MNRSTMPSWVDSARRQWKNTGASRPPFAAKAGEGQESVWDYPRPPALQATERLVRVSWGGVRIAESRRAIRLLETSHPPGFYIPREDIDMTLLVKRPRYSHCEWKGTASYFDVVTPQDTIIEAAWSYEDPFEEMREIKDYVSFYPNRFECFVDGERARAQEGSFYGGWITDDIVGPFKGGRGSSGW